MLPGEAVDMVDRILSPMDMGDDTPAHAHDSITDEALIKKRQLLVDEKENYDSDRSVDGDIYRRIWLGWNKRAGDSRKIYLCCEDTSDDADARLVAANEIAKTTAADDIQDRG